MLELVVVAVTSLLNLLLGLVVYLKNPKAATNRLFFMLTCVIVAWSSVNYISVHPVFLGQLQWIRLVLFFAALLNLSVFLTFLAFPYPRIADKYYRPSRAAIFATLGVMALTLTPAVFKSLKVVHGSASPQPAPGIALLLLQTLVLLGSSIYVIVSRYRSLKGVMKDQLRLVILGIAGTFTLIVVSNFILVVLFNITFFVPFGPAFTLVFSSAFAYAIIKHRLFDIRSAAARGLGYVLTTITLAAGYSFVIFGISSLFLSTHRPARNIEVTYTVLALLLALSFQRIKLFFDRISNSIFFKDSYDPQQFLEEFNRVLVAEVELKHILSNSISIIEHNLKSDSCAFVISHTNYFPTRLIGAARRSFSEQDVIDLRPLMTHTHQKVVVADYLEEKDDKLRQKMQEHNLAVIIRLVSSLDAGAENVGEIILGPKRSGDPYTQGDGQVLEIIANEMVIAVQNALRFEEIENFNLTLQGKVEEATKKLRRVNERLKALDETKDDFISMASHQLRTPLTSVKGYISMVLEGDGGKLTATQKDMLGQAFFSSQRMVYLIADLLNVSRLKTGKFVIEPARTNLANLVEQELGQLQETAKAKDLSLTYDKPAHFPDLMLDETKTRQVIMNFADNAIYYTPAGGHITVRLTDTPTSMELRIEDDGIGVPKAEQHHLFTKFYRAGNARKARPDGTGLGLFMAKKVVVAQGGAIIFVSQEGKGSTFGFSFPKAKLAVPDNVHTAPKPVAAPQAKPANAA